MHMADALVSPVVAGTMWVAGALVLAYSLHKAKKVSGEWFELNDNFVLNFKDECTKIESNFKHLEEHNYFFTKRKEHKHLTKKFF